jgi:hypothetical protein
MGSALARTLANSTCGGEGIKGKSVRRGAGECKSWRGLPLPEEDFSEMAVGEGLQPVSWRTELGCGWL